MTRLVDIKPRNRGVVFWMGMMFLEYPEDPACAHLLLHARLVHER